MSEARSKKRPGLFSAIALYLLAAAGLWLVSLFSDRILPGSSESMRELLISVIYYGPFLFLPVAIWAGRQENAVQTLRLNPIKPGMAICTAFMALLCVLIAQNISILWMAIWQKLGLNVFAHEYVRPANTSELTLSVLSAALVTPVCEELLFRGALMSAWEERSERSAVIATALLFACLHGNLIGLPAELFGGLLLGVVVLCTDSLYAGMIFHSVYNAALVMMDYVSSGAPMDAAEEALMETNLLGAMGGFGAVVMIVVDTALMFIIMMLISRRMVGTYLMKNATVQKDENGRATLSHRPGSLFAPSGEKAERLGVGEILVLMAGVVSGAALMVFDILSMLGG